METLEFSFASNPAGSARQPTLRGVVGSGNLEVLIVPAPGGSDCRLLVHTSARGFREIWHAVLENFSAQQCRGPVELRHQRHGRDAGGRDAAPVAGARGVQTSRERAPSQLLRSTARERVAHLFDAGSVREFLPPQESAPSPHLARLGLPGALDDGVIVGAARLRGQRGAVRRAGGAVHGRRGRRDARREDRGPAGACAASKPAAVLFMVDSGGVRLHEANAGLIAISEIMRGVLDVRAAGVPVIALIGGSCGAFGGMGIVAELCSHVVMSEEGRLALSGPDVIETVAGVEEFDARDRALVWRVTGGKHRLITGDCDTLVDDDIDAFRNAAARGDRARRRTCAWIRVAGARAAQARAPREAHGRHARRSRRVARARRARCGSITMMTADEAMAVASAMAS